MGKPPALTCPSCQRACHERHCGSKACPWRKCTPCELIIGVAYGHLHAIAEKAGLA